VEEVKDVEDEDSVVVESSFGARPASFGAVVGGYDSLVNTQNEQKKRPATCAAGRFGFSDGAGASFTRNPPPGSTYLRPPPWIPPPP
jgi:hypothetical protein